MIPRIREVHLRNYKSIGDAVVRLSGFNVLVGPNGSGKSNFMDALTFMKDCLHASIGSVSSEHSGILRIGGPTGEFMEAGIRVIVEFPTSTADYGFLVEMSGRNGLSVLAEQCRVTTASGIVHSFALENGNFTQQVHGIRPVIGSDRLGLYAASAVEEFRPLYEFLTGIRLYTISPTQLRQIWETSSETELYADGANAAWVIGYLQRRAPDVLDHITRLLSSVVPDFAGIAAVDFGGRRAMMIFERDVSGSEARPMFADNMSDGTLRMLGLLLSAYQPDTPTVLQIEEPEATIHPAAAEVVMSVLLDAAKRSQVIVSTHSPDILDNKEFPDDAILVVSKQHGETRISPLGSATREVIRRHLYSPGELLRIDELHAEEPSGDTPGDRDFFAPITDPVGEAV